jgi:LysM repeat protein
LQSAEFPGIVGACQLCYDFEAMKQVKRLLYYLLINFAVSACATLGVIQLWAWGQPSEADYASPMAAALTQIAAPRGNGTALAAIPGVVIITQVVTLPAEIVTPYPTRGVVAYTVREGDTLSGIASYFGVSLEDLLSLNSIRDPDRVVSGTELLIPPPPTITPTPTPQDTPTPRFSATPSPSATSRFTPSPTGPTPTPGVVIASVIGAGDLASEQVQLRLGGGGVLSLEGWKLLDEDGHEYRFPNLVLRAGAEIGVFSRAGQDTVLALYWNQGEAVWRAGETVTLLDASGNTRARYKIP